MGPAEEGLVTVELIRPKKENEINSSLIQD